MSGSRHVGILVSLIGFVRAMPITMADAHSGVVLDVMRPSRRTWAMADAHMPCAAPGLRVKFELVGVVQLDDLAIDMAVAVRSMFELGVCLSQEPWMLPDYRDVYILREVETNER